MNDDGGVGGGRDGDDFFYEVTDGKQRKWCRNTNEDNND